MKAAAITLKAFESVVQTELKEIINVDSKAEQGIVLFNANDLFDLCKFSYKAQSITRVFILLEKGKIDSLKDLKIIEKTKIPFKDFFDNNTKFLVRCSRIGDHGFSTGEVESKTGEILFKRIEKQGLKPKVDVNNPNLLFFIYIYENKFYFGIDVSGFDLSKRDYKIFSSQSSLKGTLAYSFLRLSGYKKKDTLLDPFPKSGEIAIEAAFFSSGKSPNYYRKDNFIFALLKPFKKKYEDANDFFDKLDKDAEKGKTRSEKKQKKGKRKINAFEETLRITKLIQKNAKIAGILDKIKISKIGIEWLDTKLEKNSIDRVVTFLPLFSKKIAKAKLEKLYKEFFYQLEYVLAKKGTILILCNNKDLVLKPALEHKFKLNKEIVFKPGKKADIELVILMLKRE